MPAGENGKTMALGGVLSRKVEVKVAMHSCYAGGAVMDGKSKIVAQQVT